MCDVAATCPNCGQQDLDQDEKFCLNLDGISTREYRCHLCDALITVTVRAPLEPALVG